MNAATNMNSGQEDDSGFYLGSHGGGKGNSLNRVRWVSGCFYALLQRSMRFKDLIRRSLRFLIKT